MKKVLFFAALLANMLQIQSQTPTQPPLIPYPAKLVYLEGVYQPTGPNGLEFIPDATVAHPEGYKLSIRPEGIKIRFREPAGAFYAVQTLNQLATPNGVMPCLDIEDAPRYAYRGMHLDVGRHFFPVEFIKKYIDLLARYKMNRFHWHLTEDQGWRIEIKKYPRLQEVAAWRKETLVGHYSQQPHQFDGQRYGGYYTQEEIKDVVAYAKQRHVTIVPEIEMPGHSQAVLAAYPELSCHGQPVEVATKWGVFENVLCPTEETFEFLENVLLEVMDLFPGEYIHIGGDECPKAQWKASAFCQELMKKEGLKDEHELQSYFIRRIDKFLTSHGRKLIGWDEILEGGLSPNATVMSWRGVQGGIDAARAGHDVIMTPTSFCYFDYYQSMRNDEPLAIGGFLPLEKVYIFEPTPSELTAEEAKHILGAQGNVWTEYMPSSEQVEYMAFPRAIALAEVLWTQPENRNYKDFLSRLERELPRLPANYADHLFDIFFEMHGNEVTLSNRSGAPMSYILGEKNQEAYTSPISISTDSRLKAWRNDLPGKPLDLAFHTHALFGKRISWAEPPHINYFLTGGAQTLSNGLLGSDERFGDGQWLGWWGKDIVLTADLDEPRELSELKLRFYQSQGEWIYLPREVEIAYSDDGEKYTTLEKKTLPAQFTGKVFPLELTFPKTNARYWKLTVKRHGIIAEGAQGAGHEAWVFLDEWMLR
ncbi:MAG: family 20 glycosylhydrolase [Saprospiraceae bacterium]